MTPQPCSGAASRSPRARSCGRPRAGGGPLVLDAQTFLTTRALTGSGPLALDARTVTLLTARLGASAAALSSSQLELELQGQVTASPLATGGLRLDQHFQCAV